MINESDDKRRHTISIFVKMSMAKKTLNFCLALPCGVGHQSYHESWYIKQFKHGIYDNFGLIVLGLLILGRCVAAIYSFIQKGSKVNLKTINKKYFTSIFGIHSLRSGPHIQICGPGANLIFVALVLSLKTLEVMCSFRDSDFNILES